MPSILPAMAEKIPMELLDVILGERQVFPRPEEGLHDLGIACHFLLVATCERSNFEG